MVKATPPLYLFLILMDNVVQYLAAHHARGIRSIRTYDAHHRIMIVQVHQPLQVLLRVLPFVVIAHVAHVGLVHRDLSLPKSSKFAPCPMFPSLILHDIANPFDIVLHPCQSVRPRSGRDAVGEAVNVVAPAQKVGKGRQNAQR